VTFSVHSLVLVTAIAAAAPLIASLLARWIAIPLVVFEIGLGIVLGPQVLNWIQQDHYIEFLANLGLAMLFLLAGYEINFSEIRGRPIRMATYGWGLSLLVGITIGIALPPTTAAGVMIGICLTTTSLGTILPVLRDAGQLGTPLGTSVQAIGAVGEFGPLIAVTLFFSGRSPARASAILIGFAVVIALSLVYTIRYEHARVHRLIEATMHTSGQFAVRLVILILAALAGLATAFGLDLLIGAFAAGVLINLLLAGTDPTAKGLIEAKLDAIGFGFLVPIFFISTGLSFDLRALIHSETALELLPTFLVLFLVVRGFPATLAAPAGSNWRQRSMIALFGATGLPLIVAITEIGVQEGVLRPSTAAALVGAGMLSVLTFPLLALRIHGRAAGSPDQGNHR
jgi:Kef-type K+ transport system membrane component KefB